ncbi:hypothetical protein BH11VER1_BH11VER1_40410 [soil metagenome]
MRHNTFFLTLLAVTFVSSLPSYGFSEVYPQELTAYFADGKKNAENILSNSTSKEQQQIATETLRLIKLAEQDWPAVLKLDPKGYSGATRSSLYALQFYYGARTEYEALNGYDVGGVAPSVPAGLNELDSKQKIDGAIKMRVATISELNRLGVLKCLQDSESFLPVELAGSYYRKLASEKKFLQAIDPKCFERLLNSISSMPNFDAEQAYALAKLHLAKGATLTKQAAPPEDKIIAKSEQYRGVMMGYQESQRQFVRSIADKRKDLYIPCVGQFVNLDGA